jgi:flavin reductase (DIM6/NTAB) family NADH-FMN oxidoreductase RutF
VTPIAVAGSGQAGLALALGLQRQFPWWKKPRWKPVRFDQRDFRNAAGQFATGVAVVTTRAVDGTPHGVTANSFTSVSLDPPLILWCQARQAKSAPFFQDAKRFAVNVLAADQHHLSRQFATPSSDKWAGVAFSDGTDGVPLLDGVIARFLCRRVGVHDCGDHLIYLGEVEACERLGGEPLIFHSGCYRVAARHPEFPEA